MNICDKIATFAKPQTVNGNFNQAEINKNQINMKTNFITFLLLISSISIFSQEKSNELVYKNVVNLDSITTQVHKVNEIYSIAKSWFAEKYNNAKNVIQLDDKENGKIIGKGIFEYNSNVNSFSNGTKGYISYTIVINVKDGKYKYNISDFVHHGNSENVGGEASFGFITTDEEPSVKISTKGWRIKVWNDIKKQIEDNSNALISSLNDYMIKSSKKDEKW